MAFTVAAELMVKAPMRVVAPMGKFRIIFPAPAVIVSGWLPSSVLNRVIVPPPDDVLNAAGPNRVRGLENEILPPAMMSPAKLKGVVPFCV